MQTCILIWSYVFLAWVGSDNCFTVVFYGQLDFRCKTAQLDAKEMLDLTVLVLVE
jgi:hypothetical protein